MKILTLALLTTMGLVTGCVGFIPVPASSSQVVVGWVIQAREAAFIVPGQTTRAHVVERLGADFRASPRMPVLAYSWNSPEERLSGGGLRFAPRVVRATRESLSGVTGALSSSPSIRTVDVTKTRFIRLSSRKSLDEQLEAWGAACYAKQNHARTAFHRQAQ